MNYIIIIYMIIIVGDYSPLAYTQPVNSVFRALWLVH